LPKHGQRKWEEKEENGDRYLMLDIYYFMCDIGQKFSYKGVCHAQDPSIDHK
jgi:hypothetical protein